MSRQTLSPMPSDSGGSGRPALRLAASAFWILADSGWALAVAARQGQARLGLWIRRSPVLVLQSLKSIPDNAADFAIGGALKAFELRWPIVTLASLAGATAIAGQWPLTARRADASPAEPIRLMSAVLPREDPAPARPRAGPKALQDDLDSLVRNYGEPVGIAIVDSSANWIVDVRGDKAFPQQSVSKLWVALTTLDAVDRGVSALDRQVVLTEADRSVFNQPISYRITPEGFPTTISDLLNRALIESDNAANDKLMALAGGPEAVRRLLKEKGIEGISLAEDERHLQAHIAGLTWSPELAPYGAFNAARARLPMDVRKAALDAYIDHPYDGANPRDVAMTLARLQAGKLLSRTSTQWILSTMAKATTGPNRLKGGLPEGWRIAHKTGTGQDFQGASIGINDVGLVTAPDGKTKAVAVFLQKTKRPVPERLALLQAVSQALVAQWAREVDKSSKPGSKESMSAD